MAHMCTRRVANLAANPYKFGKQTIHPLIPLPFSTEAVGSCTQLVLSTPSFSSSSSSLLLRSRLGIRPFSVSTTSLLSTHDYKNNVFPRSYYGSNAFRRDILSHSTTGQSSASTTTTTTTCGAAAAVVGLSAPIRSLSTQAKVTALDTNAAMSDGGSLALHNHKHSTNTDTDSSTYALVPRLPPGVKLQPRVVRQRLAKMKTYVGSEKGIRHSPWRLNLVCRLAAGLSVQESLLQLQFCQKTKAPLVAHVVQRTANLASIRDGLKASQLEVAECFATHGTHLKRLKPMAKGRTGIKRRRHSNVRVVLREIDFDLKILQSKSTNQKKKWLMKKQSAQEDAEQSRLEREELEELERATQKRAEEKMKKKG